MEGMACSHAQLFCGKCEPEIELQSRRKRKDDMLIVVKYWIWVAGITLIRICRTSAEVVPNPLLQNLP
jgi:hypothetical protein